MSVGSDTSPTVTDPAPLLDRPCHSSIICDPHDTLFRHRKFVFVRTGWSNVANSSLSDGDSSRAPKTASSPLPTAPPLRSESEDDLPCSEITPVPQTKSRRQVARILVADDEAYFRVLITGAPGNSGSCRSRPRTGQPDRRHHFHHRARLAGHSCQPTRRHDRAKPFRQCVRRATRLSRSVHRRPCRQTVSGAGTLLPNTLLLTRPFTISEPLARVVESAR